MSIAFYRHLLGGTSASGVWSRDVHDSDAGANDHVHGIWTVILQEIQDPVSRGARLCDHIGEPHAIILLRSLIREIATEYLGIAISINVEIGDVARIWFGVGCGVCVKQVAWRSLVVAIMGRAIATDQCVAIRVDIDVSNSSRKAQIADVFRVRAGDISEELGCNHH